MKKDIRLTTWVEEPEVLENIIEKLALRRNDMGYGNASVPSSWIALETSSVETFMAGWVEYDFNETQRIRIPYITCFLFSCKKEKNEEYELSWSFSLC
jgi:hypothetical protein